MATLSPTVSCQGDLDCPEKSICFLAGRTLWVRQTYGTNSSLCECSRSALHDGYPLCNFPTPAYYGEIALHSFELLLISVALVCGVYDFVRLRTIGELQWRRPLVQTSVFLFLANVCHILSICYFRVCGVPQARYEVTFGFKICGQARELTVFTVLATLFSFLVQAMVAVVWLNLVGKTKDFQKKYDSHALSICLYVVQLVYFVILCGAAVMLMISVALLATIPLILILLVGYGFGGCALANILRETLGTGQGLVADRGDRGQVSADNRHHALYISLQRVRRVSWLMSTLLVVELVLLCGGALFLLQTGGIAYERDFFSRPSAICLLLAQFVLICMNLVVGIYIHTSISSSVQAATSSNLRNITSSQQGQDVANAKTKHVFSGDLTAAVDQE